MHIKRKFRGTSAEAKPTTGVSVGDEWVNTDTGETFVWTGTEWKATAPPQLLFGLASFYVDDMLIADEGITGSTKIKSGSITRDRLEKSLLVGTVKIDPPSIAATSTANVDVTVAGLTTSHCVLVMCQSDLEHGLIPIAAYVPAANTLRVRITNFTSAAIDGTARTWFYIAWIP
jgi:hypothetical protein